MNAVIGLCNFCETHGPRPIFCTQTIRDSRIDELNFDAVNEKCPGCDSIGNETGMLSEDNATNCRFLSTQSPVIADVIPLIKQAAVRSLSCEINNTHCNGNIVFFGDASRGHVLSYTFHVHDSQARGFFRLFSIIVLMKDRMFLLNMQPFLMKNVMKISSELQSLSMKVYSAEQAQRSERAQRLTSGQTNSQPPRSLIELTGDSCVFAYLHSHFVWLLSNGTRYFTENVTIGTPTAPPWIGKDEDGFSIIQMDNEEWVMRRLGIDLAADDTEAALRQCRKILKNDFEALCYCAITGIQIIVRGPPGKTQLIINCLRKIIPDFLHKMIKVDCDEYVPASECRILCLKPLIAVPKPCSSVFRIDFLAYDGEVSVKWLGEMPIRLPDLLTKIMRAIDEKLLTDAVLTKHIRVLIEDWKNKVLCMKSITSNDELTKIKRTFGVQQQDQQLINYWNLFVT